MDCSPSCTPHDQCTKWTHIDSQEVEVRSEHISTKGNEDPPKMALEAGPSSDSQEQEPTSPPYSLPKATAGPDDGTMVETSGSARDQDSENNAKHSGVASDSDTSKENVVNSDFKSVLWGLSLMFRHR